MSFQDDEARVVRYLLGELNEPEANAIEDRFIQDDDYFEELEAIEDALIDRYVDGELGPRERERFETRYGRSKWGRSRIEFSALLRDASRGRLVSAGSPPGLHEDGGDERAAVGGAGASGDASSALERLKRLGDRKGEGWALQRLAQLRIDRKDEVGARQLSERALSIADELDDGELRDLVVKLKGRLGS